MANVHPTALVDPAAELDDSVEIGAYTVIGPHVRIGAGTTVGPHVVIEGRTTIGRDNRIFQFSSLGAIPQDKKYKGEPTELRIGDRNTIREFTSFHLGTVQENGVTSVGDDNWLMAYVHIAHDCQVGNHTIFSNNAQLAGHVKIGDWAILSGYTGVHQFAQVGAHAMTGMYTALSQDLPPFMMVAGYPARITGFNVEGLRRRGFSEERIATIKQMHRLLYRNSLTLEQARAEIDALAPQDPVDVQLMNDFLNRSTRGIAR
jgi:UDP-N-acetylglucosamine acyltransferase